MKLSSSDVIAALDVGDVRIGIALARADTALPQPAVTLTHDGQIWQNLQQFIQDNNVTVLVLGLPRGLDGQETAQTGKIRNFAEQMKVHMQLPIYFQDEAVTSKQAEAELQARRGRYNKEMVDALAATYILEDFLRQGRETTDEI